jgi:hypothetical protein
MTDNDKASNTSLQSLVHDLNRNELNAECQRWALAHGKCPHLIIKFLFYFDRI